MTDEMAMKKTHPWRKTYRPERSVPKKARKAAEKKGEKRYEYETRIAVEASNAIQKKTNSD